MSDMAYRIVADTNLITVEKEVNDCIALGFVPIGGIAVDCYGDETYYCQAVLCDKDLKK